MKKKKEFTDNYRKKERISQSIKSRKTMDDIKWKTNRELRIFCTIMKKSTNELRKKHEIIVKNVHFE